MIDAIDQGARARDPEGLMAGRDQATALRELLKSRGVAPPQHQSMNARVISVTSGKGGVGKTNFTVNLALYLRQKGKRVTIIDADFGLSNIEILFGALPDSSLGDVLKGKKTMAEVITEGPLGVKFISGGSGLNEMANMTNHQMDYLIENLAYLDTVSDVVLIDTGAGISRSVVNFIRAAGETVVVTTPEPTAIMDAYSLIKTVWEDGGEGPKMKIVVNRADDAAEGEGVYWKLKRVSQRFLSVELEYLGAIPFDGSVVKAVKKQQPITLAFPNSPFARALSQVGDRLLELPVEHKQAGFKSFLGKIFLRN